MTCSRFRRGRALSRRVVEKPQEGCRRGPRCVRCRPCRCRCRRSSECGEWTIFRRSGLAVEPASGRVMDRWPLDATGQLGRGKSTPDWCLYYSVTAPEVCQECGLLCDGHVRQRIIHARSRWSLRALSSRDRSQTERHCK